VYWEVTPEKGGKPRQLKISQKAIAMLKGLPSWGTYEKLSQDI